ncbi:acyltransferase family protein [Pseudarthrobacter chlorophenolicus]|uniref:acyltransferase family protein n=1 Tax=Pseudarthrobacter chlorophenolicus TaxID=85085 RepID=UPI00088D794A|nr:acyltransferase family protein [Pseudarthrobacter chlorophenolicus]SDQ94538.1 Peptidoglycan/LPS O-acetylase OafA/YrhL, contains acyltransferase and SGNH-hydrolase domains [Pseudarthrobacter chlorophenolicus]
MRHASAVKRASNGTGHAPRLDIQGLRALAVGLVVIYHLRPEALAGGFIGVDVFFVISGFLIIGSLAREAARNSSISVPAFYARRIRRLFPASAAVLVAVLLGTVLLLPQSRWQGISADVLFSLLQVQNWHQALSAVSYAGATGEVSPLQHFWSLAVEEQFYLVIPFFFLGLVLAARRLNRAADRFIIPALSAVALVSFAYSIYLSNHEHTLAYFVTGTRVWELAVGGLAALVPAMGILNGRRAALAGWVGLAAVAIPVFFLTTDMPFPGSIAAIPVLGTALLLRSGNAAAAVPWSASRVLSLRPLTFIGDVSYSLYLWHWPVIVFAVALLGRAPRIREAILLAVLSLALAAASYYGVEQRFRHPSSRNTWWGGHRKVYVLAMCSAVLVTVAAWAPWQVVEVKRAQLSTALSDRDYPGAQAWSERPAAVPAGMPVRPDPSVAMQDVPATSAGACGIYDPASVPDTDCWFGSQDQEAPVVVVVGDSHAGQFVDPLVAVSKKIPLRIHAMVRNGCPFALTPPRSADTVYANCSAQNAITAEKIVAQKPDLVLVAGMREDGYRKALGWHWAPESPLADGYVQTLSRLRAEGLRVAVIADPPYPGGNPVECLQKHGKQDQCATAAAEALAGTDTLVAAAGTVPGVETIDLSRHFCRDGVCPVVIGNVLVYRDNHMTNTFAKSLAPDLAVALRLG